MVSHEGNSPNLEAPSEYTHSPRYSSEDLELSLKTAREKSDLHIVKGILTEVELRQAIGRVDPRNDFLLLDCLETIDLLEGDGYGTE